MVIELPRDVCQQAMASIERHFREHMDEKIGPRLYNHGVADAQERLQARVA